MMYTISECVQRVKFAANWVKMTPEERLDYYHKNPPRGQGPSIAWRITDEHAHQLLNAWVTQLENELKWATQRKEAEEKALKAKVAGTTVVEIIHEATLVSGNITTKVTTVRLGSGSVETRTETIVAL